MLQRHERPAHRLAEHLKPHGPHRPQVPVGPLPKFHPLPTRPVFEPNYFDTVIGPAESLPVFGTGAVPSGGTTQGPLLQRP